MVSNPLNLYPIIHFIENELGLKPQSISLMIWKDKIDERIAACQLLSYEEYAKYLQISSQERQELFELIVNSETWFFREKEAFDYLVYAAKHGRFNLSYCQILSLACSTGEEPYSIAMALFDAGFVQENFQIHALDISYQSLDLAEIGEYTEKSFRGKDLNFRYRYFYPTPFGYAIQNRIKEQVSFYHGNILEEKQVLEPHLYDAIFCRNLLIYLHPEAQSKLLNKIRFLLAPQGILFVGRAETEIVRKAGFMPIPFPKSSAFQERKQGNEIEDDLVKNKRVTRKKNSFSSEKSHLHDLTLHSSIEPSDKSILLRDALKRANEGAFEEAKQLCLHYLHRYGAHSEIYYLLGLLQQTQGHEEEAKHSFHKAIYLNPSHYEALMSLALLYESQGQLHQAELFRKRALKYL